FTIKNTYLFIIIVISIVIKMRPMRRMSIGLIALSATGRVIGVIASSGAGRGRRAGEAPRRGVAALRWRRSSRVAARVSPAARADQARARVDMLRHRLEQSKVRSPVVGVVVEGDLRERRGAPLKQGDALFRVARLERMYAEVLVPEADVRFVQPQARAELMFA